jgi:septum formation protein
MSAVHRRIYLTSQSPRRRELLKQIGVSFDMLLIRNDTRRRADVDESPEANEAPDEYVKRVSRIKAIAGWDALLVRNLPACPVLGADTTVTLDGKIIGKPRDHEDATAILRQLSGRQHQVMSAVTVAFGDRIETRLSTTDVTFASLSEDQIHRYLFTNEAHDKAGSYGIQGIAAAFIKRIEGSYSGVMGLPLFETAELLLGFGYPVP